MSNSIGRAEPDNTVRGAQVQRNAPSLDRAAVPSRTGLYLRANMPFDTWKRIGSQLSRLTDSSTWWLADWLIYGEKTYAGRYRRAIAETGLDYQTLRNYAWVARRFKMPQRRSSLSFGHHAEVAAVPVPSRDGLLDRAEAEGWSCRRLRRTVQEWQGSARSEAEACGGPPSMVLQVPREQRERWQAAARMSDYGLRDWMALTLDRAASAALETATAR